ncbi:agmatine/peptidylarginine deiminase [Paenibacillus sp. S150]|uniref:agmatine deiminase family protein n=1 Tax=Paenibacillus sp. S150 TaxID=2749826 RepID=UPI001C573E82|nr:agmatine deiminase family protein [Paenibacillus sp. S150]MBW4085383.1 agmatine deiminase family protein [Paenibacillus sp. S150]
MYPKDLNYTMPPEWGEHERTFISWPVQASMVFPDNYESVSAGYAEIIRAIAEFEPVSVVVNPDELEQVEKLALGSNVTLLPIRHNDAWLRDNGPTFVKGADGTLAGVNWKFNAWGGKYSPWDLDDEVAPQILEQMQVTRYDAPLVMEGGSIHTDGEGTLITTEECLLNKNRNPELDRGEIEEYVRNYTGTEAIIWLKRGLSGDETDGHVDNIACFAAPGKVLIQVCDDPQDENYGITRENLRILENAADAKGRKLEIVTIQQPPRTELGDIRLTLSYLNFYFVNGGIILPAFGGAAAETDKLAERKLAALFPDRRIRTVNGMAVIGEGGNVHCTTQQMPAGTLLNS